MTGVAAARDLAIAQLLAERNPQGFWEGRLSSSAVSTATALSALVLNRAAEDEALRAAAVRWLQNDQNDDGGWGDTPESPTNLAATLLALAALTLAKVANPKAEALLKTLAPDGIPAAVKARYGADRTFAVPILLTCALAGLVPWSVVPSLPFELAVVPARLYPLMKLQVVSYALPALIAVGLMVEAGKGGRNQLRKGVTHRVLQKLVTLQPSHGGFLDAAPLTSFVAMSLAACFPDPPSEAKQVQEKAVGFLRQSVREDGSWPIDSDLSAWLTSSALNALYHTPLRADERLAPSVNWLRDRQTQTVHPFTNSAPGGWPWTHREGGVPDGDDTSGALLAMRLFGGPEPAMTAGEQWLLDLQNEDGGWPTFCRGWGRLPFDQSSPDITAHALRALAGSQSPRAAKAIQWGRRYLANTQREDGSWVPLWFGSQLTPGQVNPVLGTARVLVGEPDARGLTYLLHAQNLDGSWGAERDVPGTVEETALAVIALCACAGQNPQAVRPLQRGALWLSEAVTDEKLCRPAPIGLYFASLWYSEKLYPLIWTVEALGRAVEWCNPEQDAIG